MKKKERVCGFINLGTSEIHLFCNLQVFYWHFLEILQLFIFLVLYLSYPFLLFHCSDFSICLLGNTPKLRYTHATYVYTNGIYHICYVKIGIACTPHLDVKMYTIQCVYIYIYMLYIYICIYVYMHIYIPPNNTMCVCGWGGSVIMQLILTTMDTAQFLLCACIECLMGAYSFAHGFIVTPTVSHLARWG